MDSIHLYECGGMQNLNDLIDPSSGFYLVSATAINDSGQIVGEGYNAAGQNDAFLLTPVPEPEPSSLCLLIVAAFAFLATKTRGFSWGKIASGRILSLSGSIREIRPCAVLSLKGIGQSLVAVFLLWPSLCRPMAAIFNTPSPTSACWTGQAATRLG